MAIRYWRGEIFQISRGKLFQPCMSDRCKGGIVQGMTLTHLQDGRPTKEFHFLELDPQVSHVTMIQRRRRKWKSAGHFVPELFFREIQIVHKRQRPNVGCTPNKKA